MDAVQVLLVGDSDIERWPPALWPCVETSSVSISGQSGATVEQVVPYAEAAISQKVESASRSVLVFCAGGNDISKGIDVDESSKTFEGLLNTVMDRRPDLHVIVLGPKFEPWMGDDRDARRAYITMSERFHRECKIHRVMRHITFVDCLTMFCGESAEKPGGLHGGQANADPVFFHLDQLHLNDKGYRVWKQVVEQRIQEILELPVL